MDRILEEWKVNTSITTPLYKQLANNIRWSISTGKIQNGWTLPPLRELARHFNLSVNTVRAAYKLLEEQQLVVTRPHHGTEVVNPLSPESIRPAALVDADGEGHLFEAVMKLYNSGHNFAQIEDVFKKVLERVSSGTCLNKVLFVECSEYDARSLGEQLAAALGVYVDPVVLGDLSNYLAQVKTGKMNYKAIVTTYFHYAAVLNASQIYDIPVYGVVVEMGADTLNYISALPADSKIGVVCQPDHSLQYLLNSIQTLVKDMEIRTAYTNETESLKELIAWGDVFIITQPCEQLVKELSPEGPVFFFYDRINGQSVTMLREYLQQQKINEKE